MTQPEKSDRDSTHYSVRVQCNNCGADKRIDIPRGQTIEGGACSVCGCRALKRALFSTGYRS